MSIIFLNLKTRICSSSVKTSSIKYICRILAILMTCIRVFLKWHSLRKLIPAYSALSDVSHNFPPCCLCSGCSFFCEINSCISSELILFILQKPQSSSLSPLFWNQHEDALVPFEKLVTLYCRVSNGKIKFLLVDLFTHIFSLKCCKYITAVFWHTNSGKESLLFAK